jgi:hypothetical protein
MSFQFLQTGGVITIPNFLHPGPAARYYKFFNEEMPSSWWHCATSINSALRDTKESEALIEERRQAEAKTAAEKLFAYSFHRTLGDHVSGCSCAGCEAEDFVKSPEVIDRVSQAIDLPLESSMHVFASYYAPGDFLSTHTDINNGLVAFVLNLTKDWHPQLGGMLHLLSYDDLTTVDRVITPRFNEMVLFDVRGDGRGHFVSPVAPHVKQKRLAISGWYK